MEGGGGKGDEKRKRERRDGIKGMEKRLENREANGQEECQGRERQREREREREREKRKEEEEDWEAGISY